MVKTTSLIAFFALCFLATTDRLGVSDNPYDLSKVQILSNGIIAFGTYHLGDLESVVPEKIISKIFC